MKSAGEFLKLYSDDLAPILRDLEPNRKALLTLFWSGIIFLLASVPGLVLFSRAHHPVYLLATLPFVLIALYQFFRFAEKKQDYAAEFKNCVIRQLVALIDPALEYFPHRHISEDDYRESDIFRNDIDRFNGDDLVEGAFGVTRFRFSELLHQEKRETTDAKGRRRTRWVTVFKGIFFIADFNKHFHGRTYVVPDAGSSFLGLGKLFEKWSHSRGELVELENPEFEKLFTVYGTDQVEARYILSPSLMARLVNFRHKAQTRVHISFIHSKLFVALSVNKNLFEPHIFSSGVQRGYLQDYFRYLDLVAGIIDDLNLNLRIWGKV
ncbi:MAG: DUF3137 domain-containing protein [Gammaproteobacteria bacterium]